MKYPILFLPLLLLGCKHAIQYEDDVTYITPSLADSPEFPVTVNNTLCKDADGVPGLCSKRVGRDKDTVLRMDALPFSYRLNIECSGDLASQLMFDVPDGDPFTFTIDKAKYKDLKSFICIGEIFLLNSNELSSVKFEVRIKLVDPTYTPREVMYLKGSELILGKHARYAVVCLTKLGHQSCFLYESTPVVSLGRYRGDIKVTAYSFSSKLRLNYIGM